MAIDYEWIFSQFDTKPSQDGLTDVVSIIHWRLNATDDTGTFASIYGTVTLGTPGPSNFVPYDQITKELTIQWIEENMDVDSMKANLANQIHLIKNPTVVSMSPPFASAV